MPKSGSLEESVNPTGAAKERFVDGADIASASAGDERIFLFKTDADGTGHIKNPTQEQNGPNINGRTDGYTPLSFTAPVTGTYSFRFLSREFGTADHYEIATPAATVAPTATPKPTTAPVTTESPSSTARPAVTTPPSGSKETYIISGKGSATDRSIVVNSTSNSLNITASDNADDKNKTFKLNGNTNSNINRYIQIAATVKGTVYVEAYANSITNGEGYIKAAVPSSGNTYTSANATTLMTMTVAGKDNSATSSGYPVAAGETIRIFNENANVIYTAIYFVPATEVVTTPPTVAPTPTPTVAPTPTPTVAPTETPVIPGTEGTTFTLAWDSTNNAITLNPASDILKCKPYGTIQSDNNGIKIAKWNDGAKSGYYTLTSQQSGKVVLNVDSAEHANRVKVLTTEPSATTIGDNVAVAADTTVSFSISAGQTVYVCNIDGNVTYRSITFTPDAAKAAMPMALAAEAAETPLSNDQIQPLYRTVSEQWAETPSMVGAWDITVTNNGKVQTGRVWSDMLCLNAGAHVKSIYSKVYILTKDRYTYKFDFNGIQPYSFAFYSNRRGFLVNRSGDLSNDADWQPFRHSYFSAGEGNSVGESISRDLTDALGNPILDSNNNPIKAVTDINYKPKNPAVDYTNKIFLNEPKDTAVLNAYSKTPDPGVIDLLKQIIPKYEGAGTAAGEVSGVPYGTTGAGGTFTFTIKDGAATTGTDGIYTFSSTDLEKIIGKTFCINLDFSGYALDENNKPKTAADGTWEKNTPETQTDAEKNNIVKLSATITGAGTYNIVWNGEDSYGNAVPAGVYGGTDNSVISTTIEQGSVHFPLIDVERVPNGIKIERLTAPDGTENYIYYNNKAPENSWYFSGDMKGLWNLPEGTLAYPSKIGDGENRTAGVNTSTDSAPKIVDYTGVDDKFKSSVDKTVGRIKDTEAAYGNYCAIDMWSNYTTKLNSHPLTIGVQDTKKFISLANVTFIQANKAATGAEAPFDKSHSKFVADEDRIELNAIGNSGSGVVFGNTISTGFIPSITGNDSTIKSVDINVDIPAGSYIKVPYNETSAWATDTNAVLTDEGNVVYNKGSIFKLTDKQAVNVKYNLPEISSTGAITFGLIFDNLYAPNAVAAAEYKADAVTTDTPGSQAESYDDFVNSSEYINARNEAQSNPTAVSAD